MLGFGLSLGMFVNCVVHFGAAVLPCDAIRPFFYAGFACALVLVGASIFFKDPKYDPCHSRASSHSHSSIQASTSGATACPPHATKRHVV